MVPEVLVVGRKELVQAPHIPLPPPRQTSQTLHLNRSVARQREAVLDIEGQYGPTFKYASPSRP
jgi:hypothetical protein